jgi:excisionase family DNA binding protein
MSKEFLTANEAARVLRMSYRQVNIRLNTGELPGIKLGNWRIPKSELQRWMDEKGMRRDIDYVW